MRRWLYLHLTFEGRAERRMAREFMHQTPWRSCNEFMRGFCLRCFWWSVTGRHERELAAHLERAKTIRSTLTPIRVRKNAEGRWEREAG